MSATVLAVLTAVVPTILTAIFASKWWKEKTGKIGQIIQAAAEVAVQKTEVSYVVPTKLGAGTTRLAPVEQARAKSSAMTDVVDALTPILGDKAAQLAPAISDAIEAVIDRIHKRLPDASRDKFDKFRISCFLPFLLAFFVGCQTFALPEGWNDSNRAALDATAAACASALYGENADPSEIGCALRAVGLVGAEAFKQSVRAGLKEEAQNQAAAIAMENHASFVYAKLLNGGTLGAMIRGVTGIAQANDADQVLGLLYAALEHQERAFATPATVSVSGDDIGKFIALPAYSVIYLGE